MIERGWIGGGNTGRNTTIVRSNYLYPESARLYDFSLQLYEGLSQALNFNIMLSQRGLVLLAHSRHDLDAMSRWANAMRMNGIAAELLSRDEVGELAPALDLSPRARLPVLGGFMQRRAGTARHDAVAWGYARAASALGVDIIQNCEVVDFLKEGGRVVGVNTSRGRIRAERVGIAAAGHSSVLAKLAGFRLPVTSYALQAMVSEPIKPLLDTVILSPGTGAYVSQSDKGEIVMGAMLDLFPSYAQRGSFAVKQAIIAATLELFPSFSRLNLMRQWAGIVDVVHDSSPIIGRDAHPQSLHQLRLGHGRLQGHPGGRMDASPTCWRRAESSAGRAVPARALHHRPSDRRSRGLGDRALMMHIPCIHCGPRDESEFTCGGTSHMARPDLEAERPDLGRISVLSRQPQGAAPRALAPHLWLRPVVQCGAPYGDSRDRCPCTP